MRKIWRTTFLSQGVCVAIRLALAATVMFAAAAPAPADNVKRCESVKNEATKMALEEALKKILGKAVEPALVSSDALLDYLTKPDDEKFKKAMNTLANGAVSIASPAYAAAMTGNKIVIGGVEYTVEEARALQLDAFLCGTETWGLLQTEGFFKTGGAQNVARGISCDNFDERITNYDDYLRLRDYYKHGYTNTVHEFGGAANRETNQQLLDAAWQKIEVRLGSKLAENLRSALLAEAETLKAEKLKAEQACKETAAQGRHLQLADIKKEVFSTDPSWQKVVEPGRITIQYGATKTHSECTWNAPPDRVDEGGKFSLKLEVSLTNSPNFDAGGGIGARSGFRLLTENVPTEVVVYAPRPGSASKSTEFSLGPSGMEFMTAGNKIYLTVGGCNAGTITYVYEFREK